MRRVDALAVVTDLQRLTEQVSTVARNDGLAVLTSDVVSAAALLKARVESPDSLPEHCTQAVKAAAVLARRLANRVEACRARRN